MQARLLRLFRPLARMPAESEVGLDALVASLKEKLRIDKVRTPATAHPTPPFTQCARQYQG